MNTDPEQLQEEINQSYFRTIVYGGFGFCAVVVFAVVYPFGEDSAPYWFLGLATLLLLTVMSLVYRIRVTSFMVTAEASALAGEVIKSSQDLFTQVYKNSPVPYLLVSTEGVIESCNTAAVRLFHLPEERLLSQNIFSFLAHSRAEQIDIVRERLAHGIALTNEEFEVVHGGGEESVSWVLLSLFYFTDVEKQRLGLLTLVDVTKQKEIDTAKSEFVSLASHQLRTPIAGMRWNTELLMYDTEHPLPAAQQPKAARLLASINRLSSLVDNFLSVSRLELGDLIASPGVVDLPKFLDEIITEQRAVILQKEINLIIPPPDQIVARCVTDSKLLGMIVTNLLVNAIKYTPARGTVTIGVKCSADQLAITVADSGIGIPVTDQRHLFTKMYRASNAKREVTEGTGLGLYIAKRAALVLHGNITFTSGVGVGSTFTVTIPYEAAL